MRKPRKAKSEQPGEQPTDDVLGLTTAAEFLKVSKPTFYRWLAQGRIKGFKAGTQWRFYRRDLQQFLETEEPVELQEPAGIRPAVDKARRERNLPPINWGPPAGEEDGGQSAAALFWNTIFREAVKARASDIHLDLNHDQLLLRYRIDGVLSEALTLPREVAKPLVARLKLMGDADITERRVPQDGRIIASLEGLEFDFRTLTFPSMWGEAAVIRILDQGSVLVGLDRLGFSPEVRERFERRLRDPQGLMIFVGPTGSGKTTTVYSALSTFDALTRKIVSIEDPVLYRMRNVMQVHVNRKMGLTYSVAMRFFQRGDPDVIVVGDIEDLATAESCIQAALTGHLVLTTMRPPDAPSTLTRLLDMGIEPFLVGAAVTTVLAQRLARKLCPKCRQPYQPTASAIEHLKSLSGFDLTGATVYRAQGCSECNPSGYRGRLSLFELLEMNDRLRELVVRRADTSELRQAAIESGLVTMLQDGLRKATEGLTTLEEVMRVLGTDRAG